MKKLTTLGLTLLSLSFFASCSQSTKRKGCKGNGSWYGKRNLSKMDKTIDKQQTYVFASQKRENL